MFYTKQDYEDLLKCNSCYISWAGNKKEIAKVFKSLGISYILPKTKDVRFFIDLNNKGA